VILLHLPSWLCAWRLIPNRCSRVLQQQVPRIGELVHYMNMEEILKLPEQTLNELEVMQLAHLDDEQVILARGPIG